jgi:dTDP-4-amino-4,6-dideoxygalactose transaminase
METEFIRFQRPEFPSIEDIQRYFRRSEDVRWYSNHGPCERLFAERLAERVGVHCVLVNNGTSGLLVAAAALMRRTSGRIALVPSFTFPATVQALVWNGLRPVFLDVDDTHFHVRPEDLSDALRLHGDEVGLVAATSSFGTPPPTEIRKSWESLCREAGVPLLIDSAAGFGALGDDGVPIGAQGDAEIVSFHVTKPFGIGEGGAIFTSDGALADEMRRLGNFDFDEGHTVLSDRGINAKLDELHAATGLALLDRFDDVLARRRRIVEALLAEIDPSLAPQAGHLRSAHQFLPVLTRDAKRRDDILLAAKGRVELRTYYEPLHLMPAFEHIPHASSLSTTESLGRRSLSLPTANDLAPSEILRIADVCNAGR